MTTLSTHVLDTARGLPVAGVRVALQDAAGTELVAATTDADGRAADFGDLSSGAYRLVFAAGAHLGPDAFYDDIPVAFRVADEPHLHVPLLLSAFSYTTYRGS